ncbi:uncharacterized protein [Typha latifolia]|uniref:uncharacterized protein isoform X1 n=2 Tax=Typha latifolia TaxID=4733 RepID=UPI003C2AB7C2
MEATLIASSSHLFSLRSKVLFSNRCMNRADLRCKLSSGSNKRQHFRTSAIKIQDAGHFGEPKNLTSYVGELAEKLCEPLLKPLKGFPWEDAKDRVLERLLTLGKNALKWSFLLILVVSSPSDLILAISRNRELLIPVGLIIGVALADFLKESLQVYFQRSVQDINFATLLLGIGSFFVLLKFISLSFKLQGRVLLSHVGNGGLMQVLWLVKKLEENNKRKSEKIVDSPSTSTIT